LTRFARCDGPAEQVRYLVKEGDVPRMVFGTATVMPGKRLPPRSFSLHERQSEISYVIRGSCRFHGEKEVVILSPGDVLYNPANTKHYVDNPYKEPCVVFWALSET